MGERDQDGSATPNAGDTGRPPGAEPPAQAPAPADPAKPGPGGQLSSTDCRAAWTVIGVLFVLWMFLTCMPPGCWPRDYSRAREAEVKANLHNIQLSIERFAVDTEGSYPQYLIGGEPKYSATVDPGSSNDIFRDIRQCEPIEAVSDPLLRKGYIDAYPRNPFVRRGMDVHALQESLTSSELYGQDPLRNATEEGKQFGTRFGAFCSAMGSVLADPRQRGLWARNLPDGSSADYPTYADVEYEFWDMWAGRKPKPYLPGQFFYKGLGPVIAVSPDAANGQPILPTEIDMYILGAYGGPRTKGKDILATEQQLTWMLRADSDDPESEQTENTVWQMTRSEVSDDLSKREGSPYSMGPNARGENVVAYGNPNGIRDGLILVLTAGEDVFQ